MQPSVRAMAVLWWLKTVFFESFTPLAVLCSSVLDAAHRPRMFSTTIARLFRGRPAHPRTPPSVERLGKRCSRPCTDFGSRQKRSKRARDSHDTILNVISANRDRVIPDPLLAPNLFKRTQICASVAFRFGRVSCEETVLRFKSEG
jgi:hypothetical protein